MKRTPLRKKSKQSIAVIQMKLWELCRKLADTIYNPQNAPITCFTCDRHISGANKQLGHFIPKAACGAYLKYDMRNLRWQCYHCNINLGGNGAEFYKRLVEQEGQKYVDKLFKDKQKIVKAEDHYLMLIAQYEEELKELKNAN